MLRLQWLYVCQPGMVTKRPNAWQEEIPVDFYEKPCPYLQKVSYRLAAAHIPTAYIYLLREITV